VVTFEGVKLLSETGEALEPEAVHEHAKAEKKRGDEEYLQGSFTMAVMHYTRAIALTRHPAFLVSVFTNRSAAHIMLKVRLLCQRGSRLTFPMPIRSM